MLNLSMHQTPINGAFKVKEERHDEAEIRELAAKMKEQHKSDTAKAAALQRQQQQQIAARGTANGPNNMLNYLTRKPTTATSTTQNGSAAAASNGGQADAKRSTDNGETGEKKPCDDESQRGHFGWATFGKIHIPYILRQGEKYCAVRMVELKLLNKYLSYLHADIYSCTCVRSYYITDAECRLLNEINHKHCDSQFGREMFTLKDLVVRLSDANKFYIFLDVCYKKLLMGSSGPSDKCGFIRINKESVVPYTVRDTQKFVPLFYFEGETENLKQKADHLSGWDLSYLKFCCKVQGIRNELFASDQVAVISLTDIKSYFPSGTEFEDYWPSKVVDSQLLIGTTTQRSGNSSVHWTRQPAAPPPKTNNAMAPSVAKAPVAAASTRKSNTYSAAMTGVASAQQHQQQQQQQQRMQTAATMNNSHNNIAAAAAQVLGWQALGANMLTPAQTEQVMRMTQAQQQQQQQQQRNTYNQRGQIQNQMVGRQQQYAGYLSNAFNALGTQQIQQPPPPLVRAQAHMSSIATNLQRQQQYQQQQQRHHTSSASMHQRSSHAHELAGIKVIPDPQVMGFGTQSPYKIQKIPVQDRSIPCINMKAYAYNEFLMTLGDFNDYFFPGITMENCKQGLMVLKIDLYLGNRQQCLILMDAGKTNMESMPLVQVRDIMQYMPQLTYMFRAHTDPPAKRSRVS